MITYLVALLCVAGLAAGQILFKVSAGGLTSGGLLSLKTLVPLTTAVLLYGTTSIAWVWVLQRIELGRIYPLMALAFVLVPLGSHFFFGERFTPQYYLGVSLIVVGIFIAVRS